MLTLDDGVVAIVSQVTPDPTPIAGYELATGRRAWATDLGAESWQLTATTAGFVAVQEYPVDQGGLDLVESGTGHIAWRSTIGYPAYLATPPVAVGSDLARVLERPQNGPSFALLRRLTTGVFVARYRLGSGQLPVTLAALGPNVFGTGLGPNGRPESGFVERIGPDGVIWRFILPQPAQSSPVALTEGRMAIQTEDLGCATALAPSDYTPREGGSAT